MAETVRYFVIGETPQHLAKLEGLHASLWRDGAWQESNWAWSRISGAGGDADAREISADEAKTLQE